MAFYLLEPTSRLRKAAVTQMLRAGRDAQQGAAWSFISTTVAFVTNPSFKRLASHHVCPENTSALALGNQLLRLS